MLTGQVDTRRLGALAHPMRLEILQATERTATSPSDMAVALGEPLGVVAYHFRVLHTAGLIELAETTQRRGFTQSFYRARDEGWAALAESLQELLGPPQGPGS